MNEIINIAEILTDVDIALYESQNADFVQPHVKPINNIHSEMITPMD